MKRSSALHKDATALNEGQKGKPPSNSGRNRSWQALFATAALAACAVVGYGQTTPPGPTDKVHGYPWWYQDMSGTRLEPCLDTSSSSGCVLLPQTGFDPSKPVTFPGNFPSEWFYYVADSNKITTNGCKVDPNTKKTVNIPAGIAKYRAAVEGTFLNGTVQPGQQITFARTKIVASGLCPNTTYTFVHPYSPGGDKITTDASGQVVANKKGGTIDTGCGTTPCDFSVASTNSRVLGGFLTSNAPGVPPGYVGDGKTPGTVNNTSGGPTLFSVAGPNGDGKGGSFSVQTDQFTVSGRKAGPVMVTPYTADFGVTTSSGVQRTLSITNVSGPSLPDIASVSSTSSDFKYVSGCEGGLPAYDPNNPTASTCDMTVSFSPVTTSGERAQLQLGSSRAVDAEGTGTSSMASVTAAPANTSGAFPDTRVRATSSPLNVNVTGSGQFEITNVGFTSGSDQFKITNDGCTGQVTTNCQVSVAFSPTTVGPKSATLEVTENGGAHDVQLSGNGFGGNAAVSTTKSTDPNSTNFPAWYQDENKLQLQPCVSGANCITLGVPGEWFYFVADAKTVNFSSTCGSGRATYRAALEGSYANGVVTPGQEITFARTKIVVTPGALCPGRSYYFAHPYGRDLITADDAGGVVANKKGATIDIGCAGAPCDFQAALSGRALAGFLQWDLGAPSGFLGDAVTAHTVKGSVFPDVNGKPTNYFQITEFDGTPLTNATTDQFTVAGQIAPPGIP